MTDKLTHADLQQFTGGTGHWYRHNLVRGITYTDGVKYMAERAGAYWLIDEIALAQIGEPRVKAEPFQAWKLRVADSKATLTCDDGNGNIVFSKAIDFTDFPLDQIDIWVEEGDGRVILLPCEH
ncbi:DUF6876 family protein [Bradyrhizobium zhanjiangense]|uniref:DUF6876 domain-containing protein n=1 Tax=Bradyrhizobium zhanjiangense TaxID=1325107 RepID=A0ABY0DG19_9BRAD|nr:DUF6876 family protein [Bradyrhizobium zhanjiangense]RXG91628.1 hypothetical protein EAS62_24420 [Bradyrhizobium zhanjiangense]